MWWAGCRQVWWAEARAGLVGGGARRCGGWGAGGGWVGAWAGVGGRGGRGRGWADAQAWGVGEWAGHRQCVGNTGWSGRPRIQFPMRKFVSGS